MSAVKRILLPLCLAIFLSVAQVARAQSLSFLPLDHWSYQALDRLVSLGLLPLNALASKPITRLEARRLLEMASARVRYADPTISRLVQEDLRRLREEFSVDSLVVATAGGAARNRQVGPFAPVRSMGASAVTLRFAPTDALVFFWGVGGAGELLASSWNELYASFQSGSVVGHVGRTALWWSPSPRSSLLLSDNAGTVPLLRIVADLPRVRLTKAIASLERTGGSPSGDVVLFATRLDWLVTPRFRLGLSETVVTTWGAPLTFYHLLHPLPVFSGIVASYDFHDALGQTRNIAVAVDFDWLMRPGIRLYGSVLVDDALDQLAIRARAGILMGLHLTDPFRTGRTSLRLEYSAVSNGTYSYSTPGGLDHAYRGRSLGHWLGPDGDDLYVELTHQVNSASSLQLSYAYTRHGRGRIGQAPPPPEDWFLSGVVERRHTLGLLLHTIQSRSLETRYRAEIASVTNRGNVAGANGWEGALGVELIYRWPSPAPAVTATPLAAPPSMERPSPAAWPSLAGVPPGRLALRSWASSMTSRGPLSGPATGAAFRGATYRTTLGTSILSLAYDVVGQGEEAFWSADLHYPIAQFEHGAVSVFAGVGGLTYRGESGGTTRRFSFSGPRLGAAFTYRLTLNNVATPFYFTGEISSPALRAILAPREGGGPFYLWTYNVGAGWRGRSGISLEVGYRGAAATWRVGTPDLTHLRWDGFYLALLVSQ